MVCYSVEKKIIYLHVCKTGGMTIERILIDQYGFKNFTFERGPYEFLNLKEGQNGFFRYILTHSKEAKEYNLISWTKFTFVRDPCSRAASGIRYLSENCNDIEFPNNLSDFYDLCEKRPFFYIHFIMTQCETLRDLNGEIKMDYIGKFENFKDELEHILFDCLGFERKDFSKYHIHKTNPKMTEFDQELVNEISRYIHKEDFEQFGY
jgi:hypothetical protein